MAILKPDKTFVLYKGKVTIDFYEKKHWYVNRKTGKIINSVTKSTGLLNNTEVLMAWACKMMSEYLLEIINRGGDISHLDIAKAKGAHRAKKEKAGAIGTAVHYWIEQYIKNKLSRSKKKLAMPTDDKVLNGVIAFLDWENENMVKYVSSERIVYSKENDFVGTLDCEAFVNGKLALVDFKTGNHIGETTSFQVSGYLGADEEERKIKYQDRIILHINKDEGTLKAIHLGMENHKRDYQAFVALNTVTKILTMMKKKGGRE